MTSETALFIRKIQVRIDDDIILQRKILNEPGLSPGSEQRLVGEIMGLQKANEIINKLVEESQHWDEAVSAAEKMTPKNCGYYDEE